MAGPGLDEGPDVGGPAGPYRQSERLALYWAALDGLRGVGLAYPCFCSRAEVAAAARAPQGPGEDGPVYPGTCRDLSATEAAQRALQRRPAWRFRTSPGVVAFHDGVFGPRRYDSSAEVGDFVLARADGVASYQLAVVVDDAAMGVTEVLRGEDLLVSTARQILIYRALSLPVPDFAHVPLVNGDDGVRLSKRHGALSLSELRQAGADPRGVVGLLASLSGLAPEGARLHPRDLLVDFSLRQVPRSPAVLSEGQVRALTR